MDMCNERQKLMDGLAVYLARNKSAKELDELFAVAETNEQKATVRFARKMRREIGRNNERLL